MLLRVYSPIFASLVPFCVIDLFKCQLIFARDMANSKASNQIRCGSTGTFRVESICRELRFANFKILPTNVSFRPQLQPTTDFD